MTVQELLLLVDNIYPNAESDQTKVSFMNIALHTMSKYFGKIAEDRSLYTVKDEDDYKYPEGIEDAGQIVSLAIGRQPIPTNRYDYHQYRLSKSEHHPMFMYSYHEILDEKGNKRFALYPAPDKDGLPIIIRYHKIIPNLVSTSAQVEPEIDRRFHEGLAFYCVHMLAAQGAAPDKVQADFYMQKFDEVLDAAWRSHMERERKLKKRPEDNPQWHRRRSYGMGFEDSGDIR